MPFISRDQVDPEVRKKFDAEHKARLRRTLSDLSLTKEQRAYLTSQLSLVGQPKQYVTESPRSEEVPAKPKNPRKGRRNK